MSKICYCNKCGKQIDQCNNYLGLSVHCAVGYGSDYDGDVLDLDLCSQCTDNLINSCVISPVEMAGGVCYQEYGA